MQAGMCTYFYNSMGFFLNTIIIHIFRMPLHSIKSTRNGTYIAGISEMIYVESRSISRENNDRTHPHT